MSNELLSAVIITILAIILQTCSADEQNLTLPIVTGNFSVNWIQHSPIGAWPDPNFNGEPVPPPENWAMHRKAGIKVYEDYVAWGAVEREPGVWDWSRQIEVAENQRAGGLEYDPYLWLMNPPLWMCEGKLPNEPGTPDHFTMMKCLEHGEVTYTLSIWDPATLQWFERYYRECHKAMGDKIGRIYIGLVGPYGEGNYPLPIPDWVKIGHSHEGYWCGDVYARRAFQQSLKNRYVTLAKLNSAWGTDFAKWADVDFPPEIKAGKLLKAEERTDPKARRRWVDFIEWYHQSLIDFSVDVTKAAMKYFPVEKLKMKPGGSAGGVNPIAWGTYCPGYAKALGRARFHPSHSPLPHAGEGGRRPGEGDSGFCPHPDPLPYGSSEPTGEGKSTAQQELRPPSSIRLQPADCHGRPFGDRWYGTAYRFYGIPFTTEPAGGMDGRTFLRRVFMDSSNGTTEMFSYEWDKHKDDGLKWIHLYDGVPSITDVAVYCPTTWYRMNGDIWPTIRAADALRDITDFEVADELLINDDYLRKSKTRVLVWLQGSVVERSVLEKVVKWVEGGGILVAGDVTAPTDVEGRDDLGTKLFPPVSQDKPMPVTQKVGKGFVLRLVMPYAASDIKFAEVIRTAVYHPEKLSPALRGAPEVDSASDGVWTAVFPNRLLLYNNNDKPVDVERTWNGRNLKNHLEPGELAEIKP